MKIRKNCCRKILYIIGLIFILMNITAFFHAYKFTHFTDGQIIKTDSPENLSFGKKVKILLTGIDNPRPENKRFPDKDFEIIHLNSNKEIECWYIKTTNPRGTIILFHGYCGEKSSMLDQSTEFLNMGFNTMLVDFMGSGGSEGNQTTIGFMESKQVKTCYDYLIQRGEEHICLFGTSMGAAAILKALSDDNILPEAIIIECPYGSMYQTVSMRFHNMGVPAFPMADLLVFWGGLQNGFWGFNCKPEEYAKDVTCPALVIYGEKDKNVSRKEIDAIFKNMKGEKGLKLYSEAGHADYFKKYKEQWVTDVNAFLDLIITNNI